MLRGIIMKYKVKGKVVNRETYCNVIATASQKGGVMKSLMTLLVGQKLADMGFKVLLGDTDSQRNLSLYAGAIEYPKNIFTVLTRDTKDIHDAIVPIGDNLDLLLGSTEMKKWSSLSDTIRGGEKRLDKALVKVKPEYDFILIDTPPAIDGSTINAIVAADGIIIPTEAKLGSVSGILELQEDFEDIRDLYDKPDLHVIAIVPTRVEKGNFGRAKKNRARKRIEELSEIAEEFETVVFERFISDNIDYENVAEEHLNYFASGVNNVVTSEITHLVKRILELEEIEVC